MCSVYSINKNIETLVNRKKKNKTHTYNTCARINSLKCYGYHSIYTYAEHDIL